MEKMDTILVALDFSESPEQILSKTSIFASRYGSKIYVMHVVPDIKPTTFYGEVNVLIHDYMDTATESAQKEIKRYVRVLQQEFEDVESIVKTGDAALHIVEMADRINADLIVVGEHCREGFDHFFHRNVAEKVLRTAKRNTMSFYIEAQQEAAVMTPAMAL